MGALGTGTVQRIKRAMVAPAGSQKLSGSRAKQNIASPSISFGFGLKVSRSNRVIPERMRRSPWRPTALSAKMYRSFYSAGRVPMSYDLDQFVSDCRAILALDAGPNGREEVRVQLEHLLADQEFIRQYCGDNAPQD
jgi:hypothetical protein